MSSRPTRRSPAAYYFISDLHIGGDEELQNVEFKQELLAFLRDLQESDEDVELIVNGDAFGLWEYTELEGMEKFDALVDRYPKIFEQFRATGERIPITFIPGNHDYELACYPEYVDRLAEYNITLEQEVVITRPVGDRVIWIEHGQQRDPNNESPDFGNPYANPPGYYVNRHITSRAGKLSDRGKFNWLKDIQSVTPMTQIPDWMISNYFYREMSPVIRYAAVPFLSLFQVSMLYLGIFLLDLFGIWSAPHQFIIAVLSRLGVFGAAIDLILVINIVIIVILLFLSIPLFILVRDVRQTLTRFGLLDQGDPEEMQDTYLEGAKAVFAEQPEVVAFVYGHTHRASITELDGRVVINTGTWLKRLSRQSVMFGVLPRVFYPWYRLNYVRIAEEDDSVVVDYEIIEKPKPNDLSFLEQLLSRHPEVDNAIPQRTVLDSHWEPTDVDVTDAAEQQPTKEVGGRR